MADKSTPRNKQTVPSNWDSNGKSQGKQTGAVRPTKDAYNNSGKKR